MAEKEGMAMKYALCVFLFAGMLLMGCNASSGESRTNQEVVCNSPYIRFGTACCLDKNSNSICDDDESQQEEMFQGMQYEEGKAYSEIFQEGTRGFIHVPVINYAEVSTSYLVSAECYHPFSVLSARPVETDSVSPNDTVVVDIPITGDTDAPLEKGNCKMWIYDPDAPQGKVNQSVAVAAKCAPICIPRTACDGTHLIECSSDGCRWIDRGESPQCNG